MSEWQTKKLSEVTEKIFSGGTPTTTIKSYWNGDINWLSSGETSNRFIYDTIQKISLLGIENSSTKLALQGDTVIASAGQGKTRGQTSLLKVDSYINQSIIALRANRKEITPLWLFYNLSSRYGELRNISDSHSSRGSLTTVLLKDLEISFPSIDEQDKITKILFAIDNKIHLNTQTNQTLEAIAQAIFKHWFIDFAPVHAKAGALAEGKTAEQAELAAMASISGKTEAEITALAQTNPQAYQQLQQTASAFPSEFVESELGLVPKRWEVKKIEQAIKKIPVGKKYSQKNTFPEGHIPVLDQGKSGIIGFHNDTAGVKANIQDPVIVFANHTCYMRLIHFDFSAIQNVFAFKGQDVNIYWLYLATLGKQEFVEYKGHFPDFLIKQLVVPPKELTKIFGKIVKDNFSKIAINMQENQILTQTRDTLLPKLLSGEVEL